METRTCKTCEAPIVGIYCPECGQRHREGRITLRSIGLELVHLLTNLERGLWFTIIGLLRNPGKVIRDYLGGATVMYYQPARFLLLMTGLSALMASFVNYDEILESAMSAMNVEMSAEQKAMQSKMMHNIMRYTNIIMALNVPFSSISSFLLYRKYQKTYAEHLVANGYLFGFMSSLSIFTMWATIVPGMFFIVTSFSNIVVVLLSIWFFKSWLQLRWGAAIWRSILALALTVMIVAILGNIAIFILMKMGIMPKPG